MPEQEKEIKVTTPEQDAAANLDEEELEKISGGAFTEEEIAQIRDISKGSAPTVTSRGTQAAVGTALGFLANTVSTKVGGSVFNKKP